MATARQNEKKRVIAEEYGLDVIFGSCTGTPELAGYGVPGASAERPT